MSKGSHGQFSIQRAPFHFNDFLISTYTGSFWALLNPFALLAGVVSLGMITFQGANYLMMRTEGDIYRRVRTASMLAGWLTLLLFALAVVWVATGIDGYVITSAIDCNSLPDPLYETVVIKEGAWILNYNRYAWAIWLPTVAFAALGLGGVRAAEKGRAGILVVIGRLRRHHRHCRRVDVSIHHAFLEQPALKPHRVRRGILSSHAWSDVRRHRDLHAADHCLHLVGVQGDVGQGDDRIHRRQ